MVKKLLYCGVLIFSQTIFCSAQSYILEYTGNAKTLEVVEKFQPARQQLRDSLAAFRQVNALLADLYGAGYLRATVNVLNIAPNSLTMEVNSCEQYQWASLSSGNLPELIRNKAGAIERVFSGQPFHHNRLRSFFKKVVLESENAGYPFASIGIDSVQVAGNSISGILNYTSGPLITYDSIVIEGTSTVKAKWLSRYLDLSYGAPFNQSSVDNIAERIAGMGFLELKAPVQISFQNSAAILLLPLTARKTNRVDGIIGFSPNAKHDGNLLVTGQFDVDLQNLFGSGKRLNLEWQRLRPLSQLLNIKYENPNILGTPLQLTGAYELLKEDTSFLNRNVFLALDYKGPAHNVSFFTQFKTSRLLSVSHYKDHVDLPELNNFDITYYGFGYGLSNYRFSGPVRSGMGMDIKAAVGTKNLKKLATLRPAVYEGVDLNTLQYQIEAQYKFYLPLMKRFVLHQKLSGGKIINERLFMNDLFRLGGLKNLRGFDENQFFASAYFLSNLEVQFHYESDSYLFAFYDQSWLALKSGNNKMDDIPLGVGAGINFETTAGVVSLAYAVGRSHQQPISLRISKFHFGYVAKF